MVTTRLLDLSKELLEMIAYKLEAENCLSLMLTCKLLHDIASGPPLYHTIEMEQQQTGHYPTRSLFIHLQENPSAGKWIRHYDISLAFTLSYDEAHGPVNLVELSYHVGTALLLIRMMPNLLRLYLPTLPPSATSTLIRDFFNHALTATKLQELYVTAKPHLLVCSLVVQDIWPMLSLPGLRKLSLSNVSIRGDISVLNETSTITSLQIRSIYAQTRSAALDVFLSKLPNLSELLLETPPGISASKLIQIINDRCPNLRVLRLDHSFEPADSLPARWLATFTSLRSLSIFGDLLSDTALLHLSPLVTWVDLEFSHLEHGAIAYTISRWTSDAAIKSKRSVRLSDQMATELQDAIRVSLALLIIACADVACRATAKGP